MKYNTSYSLILVDAVDYLVQVILALESFGKLNLCLPGWARNRVTGCQRCLVLKQAVKVLP